jgi:hypothetical protein
VTSVRGKMTSAAGSASTVQIRIGMRPRTVLGNS